MLLGKNLDAYMKKMEADMPDDFNSPNAPQKTAGSSYPRLAARRDALSVSDTSLNQGEQTERDMEADCIDHFFIAGTLENYLTVKQFCDEHAIKRIIDIGCAYGHQSEFFLESDTDYVGVDDSAGTSWNSEQFTYVQGTYPCALPTRSDDLAVSVLCLTWPCYLREGEKTLHAQCQALANDFDHALLYAPKSADQALSEVFSSIERLANGFVYCTNREEIKGGKNHE